MDPKEIDWSRALHNGLTLFRLLKGDPTVVEDLQREQARAKQIHGSIETIGRTAAGCRAPNECDCPLCREEGETE